MPVVTSAATTAAIVASSARLAKEKKQEVCKKTIEEYNPKEATTVQTQEFTSCMEFLYPTMRTDLSFTLVVFVAILCIVIDR